MIRDILSEILIDDTQPECMKTKKKMKWSWDWYNFSIKT